MNVLNITLRHDIIKKQKLKSNFKTNIKYKLFSNTWKKVEN